MKYGLKDFYPHGIQGAYSEGEKQGYMLGYKKGSKETAREILQKLESLYAYLDDYDEIFISCWKEDLKELAKQYGVELKE